ncbi:amidohydrolase family protein [Pseudolysinimonas sp.]|uniref:amidohydrolase family protein n=1 Tax=Pseudolysinimonas sp. TaxID=2680009 RepID=UPI00286BACD8|nr:amidohydrolase family protein [Pseudolysinimonas sp.]
MENTRTDLVIDCHGHFTAEPAAFHEFRRAQVAYAEGRGTSPGAYPGISDDELVEIVGINQLRLQQERGTDLTILSPRASGMGHHVPGQQTASEWAHLSNDTILRICEMYPENFAPVCQLPQTVDGDLGPVLDELERCVEAGFVGCNLNPDPSGGRWTSPSLADPWWDPLWAALERLDVPVMIHASASCAPSVHTTGAHYLAADTIAFMQLLEGDVFERHPGVRVIIPHGGGAVPYHWGRFRGLAIVRERRLEDLLRNVFFDTCVYHQAGIELLVEVIGTENILFGSELLGAVKVDDPQTGHAFDDTLRYIDALELDPASRAAVLGGNARRVYPRLDALLTRQGR